MLHKILEMLLYAKHVGFNGHPPLGVNATNNVAETLAIALEEVSMGTHPWG